MLPLLSSMILRSSFSMEAAHALHAEFSIDSRALDLTELFNGDGDKIQKGFHSVFSTEERRYFVFYVRNYVQKYMRGIDNAEARFPLLKDCKTGAIFAELK